MAKDDFIRGGDFCEVVNQQLLNEFGLPQGQRVYIAGSKALPISKEDPYTQRVKFFSHLIVNKLLDPRLFLMDPNSLRKVGKKEQKKLEVWLKAQYETGDIIATVD